jgi:hypothetical protein
MKTCDRCKATESVFTVIIDTVIDSGFDRQSVRDSLSNQVDLCLECRQNLGGTISEWRNAVSSELNGVKP